MNKFLCLLLLLITVHMTTFSQISNNDILFSVGDEPVLAKEFIRVYNKNLDIVQDESQKDIDAYLDLFVNYKLKLQEAKSLGLDKKPSYLKELKGYQVIHHLLEVFIKAAINNQEGITTAFDKLALACIPKSYLHEEGELYTQLLDISCFIASLTDGKALEWYKKMT